MLENNDDFIEEDSYTEACRAEQHKKILMVATNTSHMDKHHKTGVTFVEFAVPYLDFLKEGYEITVSTPTGEIAPIDPSSENIINDIKWKDAKKALNDTLPLDTIDYEQYDALVLPGGHGPMFDLANNETLGNIINHFDAHGKLIATICHGAAGLLSAKKDRIPFVNGKRLTAFSNDEEALAKMNNLVPFSLEDALKEAGAFYIQEKSYTINVIEDENLITAQNAQSSESFARAIIKYINEQT